MPLSELSQGWLVMLIHLTITTMSIRNTQAQRLSARISRLERKCDRILAEISALRRDISPRRTEIDDVIDSLHKAASAMRQQSQSELRRYTRQFGG